MIYPWNKIPADIRELLLFSSSGWTYLLDLAVRVFESAEKNAANANFLLDLGKGLINFAWEEDPLSIHLINQLLFVDKSLKHLLPDTRKLLEIIRKNTAIPSREEAEKLESATGKKDYQALFKAVDTGLKEEPGNFFWIYLGLRAGLDIGEFAWIEKHLREHKTLAEPLRTGLLADCAFLSGNTETAATLYTKAFSALPLSVWQQRMGTALHRLGRTEEALSAWESVLKKNPWHVQLWLVRDNVLKGLDKPGDFPEGSGVILLYTWNGGEKIDQTLMALSKSRIPDTAKILTADNGSTDGRTPDILAKWAAHFKGQMRILTLPCNIGAPAARNWLLCEKESKAAEWLVFLDDDLLVPVDWLGHFGQIMRAVPDHGVYGCSVLRHTRPWKLQGADMNLLPPAEAAGPGMPKAPVHMQVANRAEEQNNFGQFAYSRPCAHVSGCCHIFRRKAIEAAGFFDVRFSPSQVDDFEHDIRMFSKGDTPLYHGSLEVRHMHTTGLGTGGNLPKAMNAYANHLKLLSLYPRPVFDKLREQNMEILLRDIIKRQHLRNG